jgi:hypothetical protein
MRDTNTSRDTVFFCYHSRQGVKYPVRGRKQGSGPPCAVEARSQGKLYVFPQIFVGFLSVPTQA